MRHRRRSFARAPRRTERHRLGGGARAFGVLMAVGDLEPGRLVELERLQLPWACRDPPPQSRAGTARRPSGSCVTAPDGAAQVGGHGDPDPGRRDGHDQRPRARRTERAGSARRPPGRKPLCKRAQRCRAVTRAPAVDQRQCGRRDAERRDRHRAAAAGVGRLGARTGRRPRASERQRSSEASSSGVAKSAPGPRSRPAERGRPPGRRYFAAASRGTRARRRRGRC